MVNAVDPAGRKINLNHNAIPSIGWPAMTMDFAVASSVDLRTIKPGAHVNFTMQQGGDGKYVIQSVTPTGGGH
jgi:Cu/Ag efflux protein CusF